MTTTMMAASINIMTAVTAIITIIVLFTDEAGVEEGIGCSIIQTDSLLLLYCSGHDVSKVNE